MCLIMGGGEGLLPMEEMLVALETAHIQGLRLVAITGHNEKLAQRLRQRFAGHTRRFGSGANPVEVYGFRQDVPQMLAGADMIITKAGGLTCAEVLASGLELVLYKPLPGQEQGNASYLQAHYAAKVCQSLDDLVAAVGRVVNEDRPVEPQEPQGNPLAAEQICAFVLQKLAARAIV